MPFQWVLSSGVSGSGWDGLGLCRELPQAAAWGQPIDSGAV